MKKTILTIITIATLVSGCGNNTESLIKDTIRNRLKDPQSAQFKEIKLSKSGNRSCIIWNAKNSMGGYGEWNIASLKLKNDKWEVVDMTASSSDCNERGFKEAEAKDQEDDERAIRGVKAEIESRELALKKLQESRNTSKEEAIKISETECKNLFDAIQKFSFDIVVYPEGAPLAFMGRRAKEILPKLNELIEKNDCSESSVKKTISAR